MNSLSDTRLIINPYVEPNAAKGIIIAVVPASPILEGAAIAICGAPYSEFSTLVSWFVAPLSESACFAFAIWLAWRFPFTGMRIRNLLIYCAIFWPVIMLHRPIVDLVVNTYHFGVTEALLDVSSVHMLHYTVFFELIKFSSMLFGLLLIQAMSGISLQNIGEHHQGERFRFSIASVFLLTTTVAITLVSLRSLTVANPVFSARAAENSYHFAMVASFSQPLAFGICGSAAAFLIFTVKNNSIAKLCVSAGFGYALLLIPDAINRRLSSKIDSVPSIDLLTIHNLAYAGITILMVSCFPLLLRLAGTHIVLK